MLEPVLQRLDAIVAFEQQRDSPMGFFPALYRRMTQAVADGIDSGQFEDPARMAALDIRFARRYFDAYDAIQRNVPPTQAWQAAFSASQNADLIVLQHLLLGINAHINLDLSIAAAETAPGNKIFALEHDFNQINVIIAQLTETVQAQLAEIWLPFGILDDILHTEDEGMANFSISVARRASWEAARRLAFMRGQPRRIFINTLDHTVAQLARRIAQPGLLLENGIRLIRQTESGTVAEKIEILKR